MDIYSTREKIKRENISFQNLKLRVTFYARVSTDFNVQLNSLDNQVSYFTELIEKILTGNMLRDILTKACPAHQLRSVSNSTK